MAFSSGYGVGIIRNSHLIQYDDENQNNENQNKNEKNDNLEMKKNEMVVVDDEENQKSQNNSSTINDHKKDENENEDEEGTIDVWWLVEDGGLTLLIPYLLKQHEQWKNKKLRVMTLSKTDSLTSEQIRMNRLLRKFRIVAELVVVDNSQTTPSQESIGRYEELSGERERYYFYNFFSNKS